MRVIELVYTSFQARADANHAKTQITEPFDPDLFVRTSTLFPLKGVGGGRDGEGVGGT